jgi:hypothetical protein
MVQEPPNSVQQGTIDIGAGGPKFGDLHRTFRLQASKIRWYRYETFIGISRGPALRAIDNAERLYPPSAAGHTFDFLYNRFDIGPFVLAFYGTAAIFSLP